MFCLYIYFDKLPVIVFYPFTDSYSSEAVFIEVSFYSYMYYGLILPVYWLKTSSIDSKGTKTSLTLGIASCFYGKLLSVYSFIWSSNEMTYNTWWTPHSRGLTSENLSTALLMNHLNFIRKNPQLNSFPCRLSSSRFRVDDPRVFQYKEAIQSPQWIFNLDCKFLTSTLFHPTDLDPDSIYTDCILW